MSIYTECSKAARELVRGGEPFTDLDIIERAQAGWKDGDFQQARHDAAQIAAAFFRAGRLVRFGPVEYGPEPDYARGQEGHLLYAAARPQARSLATPNGEFAEIFYSDDPLSKNGRRKGSTRNDLESWSSQSPIDAVERDTAGTSSVARENERLRDDLIQANKRIDALEQELERIRKHLAATSEHVAA